MPSLRRANVCSPRATLHGLAAIALVALLSVLGAACGDDDTVPRTDSGPDRVDTGPALDLGPGPSDTGTPDAPAPPDAGPTDTGPADAGPAPDAGPDNSCSEASECAWGEIDHEITRREDCICLFGCPSLPQSRQTVERRRAQYTALCDPRLDGMGNPCPVDDCIGPPPLACVGGVCTPTDGGI